MKSTVRNSILEKINSLTQDEKSLLSVSIQSQLKKILSNEKGTWVAFKNLKDEPAINWQSVSTHIEWAFPKIKNGELEFQKSAKTYSKSYLGFMEPQDGVHLNLNEIDGFVIPGVSFDTEGRRLGRGKGFYDRALSDYGGRKIGICFNVSLCEELPHEEHDVKCDQIVTENKIINVNTFEGVRKWN